MNGQRVGYGRVSSLDRKPVRQLDDVALDRSFTDNRVGQGHPRPALEALLDHTHTLRTRPSARYPERSRRRG
ncbi:MAG: hypothetical protein JO063_10365 [Pseudonocardiales bacterium]|nr:hypothetical protein [Pseudonocardiales bacterium]MBV9029889.1 hypothetical protein [Pseudonocardiales bacterium]MBW0010501.1 hypothetical protein [Pseudonocardiales bacterium]